MFRTLDDVDVKGKTVLVRIDINSPVEDGRVILSDRIRAHARTIRELSDKGAKVVLLAHQGRPGDKDFVMLEQHASLLSQCVGKPVKYVPDVYGERAQQEIKAMKDGEIVLLENVRTLKEEMEKLSPEEHAKSSFVQTLSKLADLFVSDALSVAHRSQASVVGFAKVLPAVAGRIMEEELKALQRARNPERPCVYVLGGAKPKDSIGIMEHAIENNIADQVLTCGVLGNLFILGDGEFSDAIRKLSASGKVVVPKDVAIERDGKRKEIKAGELTKEMGAFDIGKETIKEYSKLIKKAKTIVLNGPAGKYEDERFARGTKEIFKAVAKSKAFSLIGGGDTITALTALGFKKDQFGYVSLSGHALLEYLTGKELPGVAVLQG